jgi:hypothetical protein
MATNVPEACLNKTEKNESLPSQQEDQDAELPSPRAFREIQQNINAQLSGPSTNLARLVGSQL